jgi:hypothetical protein
MRLNETSISDVLKGLGYMRAKRDVYRASWSTDHVEHFLYFSMYGTPLEFLSVDFGLRSPGADAFGFESILAHGRKLYRSVEHQMRAEYDERTDCRMRFSLGNLADWGPQWSLYLPEMSDAELAKTLFSAVGDRLLPIVRGVTTTEAHLAFLLSNREYCRWLRTNGAMRAAQALFLAKKIGMDLREIGDLILMVENEIRPSLEKAIPRKGRPCLGFYRSCHCRSIYGIPWTQYLIAAEVARL